MRAGDGADQVIGVLHVGDPVAHRLVHRVLQRGGARGHRLHLGAQQLHAEHVGLLPLDVGRAHVDGARQAEQRAHGRGRHAVLAGPGLGDDAGLAHAPGQQDLAHAVVGLVAAGVVQLVALEVDLRAAELPGQPLGEPQRAGPADIMRQVTLQIGMERRVGLRRIIGLLDLQDQRHQRLGDKASAVVAEAAALVGAVAQAVGARRCNRRCHAAAISVRRCRSSPDFSYWRVAAQQSLRYGTVIRVRSYPEIGNAEFRASAASAALSAALAGGYGALPCLVRVRRRRCAAKPVQARTRPATGRLTPWRS